MKSQEIRAEQLLELALASGASCAEVYQSRSLSRPIFFEANRLKQLESCEAEGTALRIWRENRPGLAVAYGRIEPNELVAAAIALSELNPLETIELAEAKTVLLPDLGQVVEVGELVKLGREAIACIRDRYPEVLCSAEFECEQETISLIDSRGLHCRYTDITLSGYLGVEWVRGEDLLGVYEDREERDRLNVDSIIQGILIRLAWAKENTSPPLGDIPILFTGNAATLFWDTVSAATNGRRVLEKSSPWSDRQGHLVVAESLSLSQQPERGPYSCPFDDEGTNTQFLPLIQQGKLAGFYSDRTTGRALGISGTGNGFRPSLDRYPTPELVNIIVEPGRGTLQDLIHQLDRGLLVDRMLGGSSNISGDFSMNVDLGYRIDGGEIVGRVKDTMVAGNVYCALKRVLALGNDNRWHGSCYTPSLVVEGLSVVGQKS